MFLHILFCYIWDYLINVNEKFEFENAFLDEWSVALVCIFDYKCIFVHIGTYMHIFYASKVVEFSKNFQGVYNTDWALSKILRRKKKKK